MSEFTGFTEEHVDCVVTDIMFHQHGIIERVNVTHVNAVYVKFGEQTHIYTAKGTSMHHKKLRRLYFGSNIKVEVTGEEVPDPKLICPVCKKEHEMAHNIKNRVYFMHTENTCPFYEATFNNKEMSKSAMKNLIKALENK